MSVTDLPGVFVPSVLLSTLVLTLVLTLSLLKILQSIYLHNYFRLTPAAVCKPTSRPCLNATLKAFIPLYGLWNFRNPQFDLPPAAHLFLAAVHLSVLWAANVAVARTEEEFSAKNGMVAGAVASAVCVGLTYAFYVRYLHSFNPVECPELPSQSRTEVQSHSPNRLHDLTSFIDISQSKISPQSPEVAFSTSRSPVKFEAMVLGYVALAGGLNCWSIGWHYTVAPGEIGAGLVLQWMFGVAVDTGVRLAVCCALTALKVVPRIEQRFWALDLGIAPADLPKFRRRPRAEGHGESLKETFLQDQLSMTPPHSTPGRIPPRPSLVDDQCSLPPADTAQEPCVKDLNQWFEREELKLSPGKCSMRQSVSGEVEEPDNSECGMSEDTMPEVPHNMMSPVETPRGYSGIHFHGTPCRPVIYSPERSPQKPAVLLKSPSFELRLQAVQFSSSESEPDSPHKLPNQTPLPAPMFREGSSDEIAISQWRETHTPHEESQELYMVEFLPGGIMTGSELRGSEYDWARRKTEERTTRSAILYERRTMSVEREAEEGSDAEQRDVVSPTKGKAGKVAPITFLPNTEDQRPATYAPFRDVSNLPPTPRLMQAFVDEPPENLGEVLKDPAAIDEEFQRLKGMLAAQEVSKRRRYQQSTKQSKSVSPYRRWKLAQQLIEEPISSTQALDSELTESQSSALQALSQIYISSNKSVPRPPTHVRSRSQQRSNPRSRIRGHSRL